MRKLLGTYGMVLGTTYLVVFVLLVIIYRKILKKIRRMRGKYGECTHRARYCQGEKFEMTIYCLTASLLVEGRGKGLVNYLQLARIHGCISAVSVDEGKNAT